MFAVENAYDGEFKVTNVAWDSRLLNSDSEMFKNMAAKLEVALYELFTNSRLRDEADFNIRVTSFASGSVVVKFRISYMPKNDPDFKVSRDALMRQFAKELNLDDFRLANVYDVRDSSLNLKCKYF